MLEPILKLFNKHGTRMVFKIRDFLSVIDVGFRTRIKYDYFVGIESINCLSGLILRKFGIVDKVIYYVLDLSGNRYSNSLVNRFYIFLDRFCVVNSDFVWDVSGEFNKIRIKNGLDIKNASRVIHVPVGLYNFQITKSKIKNEFSYKLTYVGTLGDENGPDLAVKTVAVLKDKFPKIYLHFVGGGAKYIKILKQLSTKLGVRKRVKFHGFVENNKDMMDIIIKTDIALAPYKEIPGSIRYYADSSKIRTYAGAGLPIVTTNVPPLGRLLSRMGGALIARDNGNSLARVVEKIYKNKKLYIKMQRVVREFSKDNTWNNEFNKAFVKMGKL